MSSAAGYREWPPPASSSAALACLWVRVTPEANTAPTLVLPDGCVDLIWQAGREPFVAGPDTGPAPVSLPGGTVLVGARFRPGAGGPALGVPLVALRDQRVDVADLRPDLARRLPPDLTPRETCRRIARVAGHLVAARPPDPLITRAAHLLARPGSRAVDLGPALGVSERHLRRRFDAAVGYGPKTLHRVLRFRRFLAYLGEETNQVDLAELAVETGYADQAHLTRECVRLAGLTPAALARARATTPQPVLG